MCMCSCVCGVPARLQSVLSVPQLLLDRVTVAGVRVDRMQRVSSHTARILL